MTYNTMSGIMKNGRVIDGSSFAPTYIGIREIDLLVIGNFSWNPLYGKQLAFLTFTSYFDFYVNVGRPGDEIEETQFLTHLNLLRD